jgi:hypothetical protein
MSETREEWGRRIRARLAAPADTDPLAGCAVLAKHSVYPDDNKRGSVRRGPRRVVEYDVLVDKKGLELIGYRAPNGSIEWANRSSTPTDSVLSYEEITLGRPDPGAKVGHRTIAREVIEPRREIVYDDDGNEHEVIRRAPRGY